MKTIFVVDDRDIHRKSLVVALNNSLENLYQDWNVLDDKPFESMEEYRSWILENDISVLVIDERLNEERGKTGNLVNYFGHDLVKYLREYFKDLPVFMITNYPPTEELKDTLKDFNMIIRRDEFTDEADKYTNLFVVSGRRFYEEYKAELERVSSIAEKIAKGIATDAEKEEINGLKANLLIPHFSDNLLEKEEYLKEVESNLNDIKKLNEEIMTYLKETKK